MTSLPIAQERHIFICPFPVLPALLKLFSLVTAFAVSVAATSTNAATVSPVSISFSVSNYSTAEVEGTHNQTGTTSAQAVFGGTTANAQAGRRRSRASLAGRYRALSPPLRRSRGPPPRTVEQVASPISLRITRVLYLEPLHRRLMWIRKALSKRSPPGGSNTLIRTVRDGLLSDHIAGVGPVRREASSCPLRDLRGQLGS